MNAMNLRQNKAGHQLPWTKEELLSGLNYFKELNGHFPSSHEIDDFQYLPSARSIQRAHGGLVNLRKELIPLEHSNLTTGAYRSSVAKLMFADGRKYEEKFYKYLINHFEEISVHEHKLIRPGGVSCDFFIYLTENDGIVIDIFYAFNMRNLINIVNIKLKRYSLVEQETYLVVVGNPDIEKEALFQKMEARRVPLPSHIRVVSEDHFNEEILQDIKNRSQYTL